MSLKKNIIANYLGQGWTALMQLAFIPLYIKYLGIEAYGLIGVFSMLQAWLIIADLGMTMTLNREMVRFTAGIHTPQSIRELLHSLELICIAIAFLIAISVYATSSWFTQYWLHAEHLSYDTVREAIVIMGLVAALRFVEGIYRGALLGLQTQVWLNMVTAALATVRGLGSVGVLVWVSPSIEAFFLWQGCISFITVIVLAHRVHSVIPASIQSVRFSKQAVSGVWGFASGMIATTFFSLILMQADKVLLSRLLSLEAFGTYMVAATVANALSVLVGPLAQSYYPRLTEHLARQDEHSVITTYHQGSQLMTVMIVPAALILIFHGEAVLYLWTGDADLAKNASSLVALLACGTAILGLMNIPYMLQLAYGWSMFAAKVNVVIVAILIPVLFWAVPRYGAIGAAWVWVAITSSYIFIVIHIMHRRLLPKEKWAWYWQDTILPTIAAASVSLAGVWVYPSGSVKLIQVGWLLIVGFLSLITAFFSIKELRVVFFKFFKNLFNRHKT